MHQKVSIVNQQTCVEIVQCNLQHSQQATAILSRTVGKLGSFVSLIQEPYLYGKRVRGLSSRLGTLVGGSHPLGSRAAMLVSKNLQTIPLPQFCTRDLAAAKVEYCRGGKRRMVVLASAYMPFDSPSMPPPQEVELLVEFCKTRRWPIILGCDAKRAAPRGAALTATNGDTPCWSTWLARTSKY